MTDRTPVAFVDASALIAMADRDDRAHEGAVAAYGELCGAGYRLFTTNCAVDEAFELISVGLGPALARQWLRDFRLPIYYVDETDHTRARTRLVSDPGHQTRTLTDALNIAVMERLGVRDAFAVDPNVLEETA